MSKSQETQLLSSRWITYSVLGTLMMAAGLVVLMEGIVMRVNGKEPMEYGWVLGVAIIVFSAGINFIGSAVKYRIYLDRKRKQESEFGGSHSNHRNSGRHHRKSGKRSAE